MTTVCIRSSFDEGRTWCGSALEDPHFADAERAAVAGKFHSDTEACRMCCKAIIKCLGGTIG